MQISLAVSTITLALLVNGAPQSAAQKSGIGFPIIKHSTRSLLKPGDGSIDFDAVNSHVEYVGAKIRSGFENFERNTGTPHPSAMKEFERRGIGFNLGEALSAWYVAIQLGDSLDDVFYVELDTSSADLIVPSINCDSSCDGHQLWDGDGSQTAIYMGGFSETYRMGTVSGWMYTETVSLGPYSVPNQWIGAALEYPPGLGNLSFYGDGIMGLGFQSISALTTASSSFFQGLVDNSQLPENSMSFKFEPSRGQVYLGGANEVLYSGDFSYVSVVQTGYWEIIMDNLQGNGEIILQNLDCIIDTSNTLITAPANDLASVSNALGGTIVSDNNGTTFLAFPCNAFPSIAFTVDGTPFMMSTLTLKLAPLYQGLCVSTIVGTTDDSITYWTIGVSFLENVYTKLDFGNLQVGFAHLA